MSSLFPEVGALMWVSSTELGQVGENEVGHRVSVTLLQRVPT